MKPALLLMNRANVASLLVFLLLGCIASAQPYQIKGKVVDKETGEPLVGANVEIAVAYDHRDSLLTGKNVQPGAGTNLDGEFCILQIPIRVFRGILRASYIGYNKKTEVFCADSIRDNGLTLELESDETMTLRGIIDPFGGTLLIDPTITNWQTILSGDWIRGNASRRPGRSPGYL